VTTVAELLPGDVVDLPGSDVTGTYICDTPHPTYPNLRLVVWRLSDGRWSLDALASGQYIGQARPVMMAAERGQALIDAIALGRGVDQHYID
jgi:hypothetical protein